MPIDRPGEGASHADDRQRRQIAAQAASSPDIYNGWFCAVITLTNAISLDYWDSKNVLAILSGWINPLIPIYLVLLIWPKLLWPHRIVAAAMVAFMIGTWIYFALAPMVPLVGHVLVDRRSPDDSGRGSVWTRIAA